MCKSIISIVILFFLTGDFAFAQSIQAETSLTMDIAQVVDLLIGILSWAWVVLASIAGKLMTNDLVYGEFINLDNVIYQLWAISRNFANYGLWFFFLYHVIKFFFSDGNSLNTVSSILGKIIMGAVGIQMSWMLIAMTIDISTIATTALSSFPNTVIGNDLWSQREILTAIQDLPQRIKLNTQQGLNSKAIKLSDTTLKQTSLEEDEIMDFITPSPTSVAGPLMYIGFSALKVQEYMTLTIDMPSGENPVALIMTILLKFGILIVFSIALIMLVMINIFRIMYLWLFIAFTPLLILLWVFGKGDAISNGWIKDFTIPQMIKLIFTPTIYVAYLSIMLIAIVTMQRVIVNNTALDQNNCNTKIEWVALCYDKVKKQSSINIEDIDSGVTLEWAIFPEWTKDAAANTFTSLILTLFTLLLLWWLVKAMGTSGSAIGQGYTQAVTKTAGNIASSVPIIPLSWGQSVKSLKQWAKELQYQTERNFGKRSVEQQQEFQDSLDRYLGLRQWLRLKDKNLITKLATQKNDFVWWSSKFLQQVKSSIDNIDTYRLQSTDNVIGDVNTWFTTNKKALTTYFSSKNKKIAKALNDHKDAKSIQEFSQKLKNDASTKAEFLTWLHKEFGGSNDTIRTYKEFMQTPIKSIK